MKRYLSEALVIAGFFNLFLFGIALILSLVFISAIFSIMIFCLLLGTSIPITAGVYINKRLDKKQPYLNSDPTRIEHENRKFKA